jgi:transcriptional regulator with XRE-family HTH domain
MLGAYVARRRKSLNLSINALAKRAGVSHTYIADIERGGGQPSLRVITALATALGTTVDELLRAAGVDAAANWGQSPSAEELERAGIDGSATVGVETGDPRLYGVSAAWGDLQDADREILYNAAIMLRELRRHIQRAEEGKSNMVVNDVAELEGETS